MGYDSKGILVFNFNFNLGIFGYIDNITLIRLVDLDFVNNAFPILVLYNASSST
jgi:hypothetical protein